jgi:hypothetical protein
MKSMARYPRKDLSPLTGIICALLAAVLAAGCATGQKERKYKNRTIKKYSSAEAKRTDELIDRYATYVCFFKLDKDADAVSIGITADYVADITGAKKIKKTYFIVDKLIDMSRFTNKKMRQLYAEIGRNFDADWNREKELTLVSSRTEFFKKLDGTSAYRIRFTTFSMEPCDFTITISTDCGVTFTDDIK